MKSLKQQILNIYGREPQTMDELAECVIQVIEHQGPRVQGFAWDVAHNNLVSNTHSSPQGHPQNWRGEQHLPRGYPGWFGRVWIRYAGQPRSFGADPFDRTLTHTGTGGAGSYGGPWQGICSARWNRYGHRPPRGAYPAVVCYSWDYRFYDLDWPGIADWAHGQQVWSEISGKHWASEHRYSWTDPAVLAADAEFIAQCLEEKLKLTE